MSDLYGRKGGPMLRHLESMLASGFYSPGQALPALRILAEQFSVSRKVAEQVTEELAARGLVEIRRGSGCYVLHQRKKRETGKLRIGVVHEGLNLQQSYCAHIVAGIVQRASERTDCRTMQWHLLTYQEDALRKLTGYAARCDALMLVGGYDRFLKDIPRSCPAVGIEMASSFGGWISLLSLDSMDAADRAVQYFLERGVVHLHLVTGTRDPLHNERRDMLMRQWQKHGTCDDLPCSEDRNPHHGWWFSGGNAYDRFAREYMDCHHENFAASHHVLSLDGKAYILPEGILMKCDSLTTDWHQLGRNALDEAIRRAMTPGALAQKIMQGCSQMMLCGVSPGEPSEKSSIGQSVCP